MRILHDIGPHNVAQPGWLEEQKCISYSPGGWKSEVKVSAGLSVSAEDCLWGL